MIIDTSGWNEFTVQDLGYKVELARGDLKAQQCPFGDIPLVSSGKTNRGICEYVAKTDKSDLYPAGTLTVDMFGKAFYQTEPFYAVGHGRVNMLTKEEPYNRYVSLFIVKCIEVVTQKYEFNDMCNSNVLSNIKILLPVDNSGNPDWDFMNSYMIDVETKAQKNIKALINTKDEVDCIDTSNWENIPVIDLFETSLPQGDLQIKKVRDGDVPLITPSNTNNGLLQTIARDSESTLYDAGCLTVDMFGNAYYQDTCFFVTAHGHVNVLKPKFEMGKYVGLFIATAIKTMFHQKYDFTDMCTQKVLKTETIRLPVTASHTPDYQYMEDYMKDIESKAAKRLSSLRKIG